jgi:hypothetical protein
MNDCPSDRGIRVCLYLDGRLDSVNPGESDLRQDRGNHFRHKVLHCHVRRLPIAGARGMPGGAGSTPSGPQQRVARDRIHLSRGFGRLPFQDGDSDAGWDGVIAMKPEPGPASAGRAKARGLPLKELTAQPTRFHTAVCVAAPKPEVNDSAI